MLLVAGNSVRGLPVVTVRGGEDVAEVKDIVYQATPAGSRAPR